MYTIDASSFHYHRGHLVLSAPELVEGSSALLEPLFSGYPEFRAVLHDVGEDGTAEEDHVLATRGVFDPDLEFLWELSEH